MPNYYVVLGVAPQASADEIRSAYRQRALQLHPDTSDNDSEPFIRLQEAYSVLANPHKRASYDNSASEIPIKRRPARRPATNRAEPFRATDEPIPNVSLFDSFDTFGPSLDAVFERLWSNFGLSTRPKAERTELLSLDVPVSPEQAFTGGQVRLLVPARMDCANCGGHGAVGPYECWRCAGKGSLIVEYPVVIAYPPLRQDYTVQVPLDEVGIHNFFLSVSFRPTATEIF